MSRPCVITQSSSLLPFSHNTIIVLQYNFASFSPSCRLLLQYTPVYCNPNSTLQAFFSAIQNSVLQYNFSPRPATSIAIQTESCNTNFFFSQYNWAVAQIRSATYIYSLFSFHFFQLLKDTQKKYLSIFFSLILQYLNKFIKFILLIFFSFTNYKNLRK